MAQRGRIIVLSGPSGVGKNSVWESLARLDDRYARAITCTTRAPRPGEVDGVDYHFLTHEAFDRKIEAGEFAEWKPYHENKYGSLKRSIEEAVQQGRWLGLIIEVKGAAALREVYPECESVFILPPSRMELRRRLAGRGDVSEEALEARLAIARSELAASADYDYFIVNEEIETCARRLHRMLESEGRS